MAKRYDFGTGSGQRPLEGGERDITTLASDPASIGGGDGSNGGSNDSGPGDVGDGTGLDFGKPKRGRKPRDPNAPKQERKSRGRPSAADYQASIAALTSLLTVVHSGVAAMSKCPELELNEIEAPALAKASAEFMVQFGVAPDPKVQATIGLVMCCGMIYAPKVAQIRTRRALDPNAKPKNKLGLHVVPTPNNEIA
jgi:hypothetical protein